MTGVTPTVHVDVRPITGAEKPAALLAIQEWSGFEGPDLLAGAYPQVFSGEAVAEMIGGFVQGQLVAHAALRHITLLTSSGTQSATLVGTVVTAPDHRGQGIGSELLRRVIGSVEAAGRDALYLWSDKWTFYERLGFQASGVQHELELKPRPGILAPGIRPARSNDVLGILSLHRMKPLRADRTLHDQALLLATSSLLTMVLEREGKIAAYACYGKAMDFRGWWHELGGSDEDVATLVLGTMEVLGQERATLLVPPYRAKLIERVRPCIVNSRAGVGALRKSLTPLGQADFFVDGLDSI